MLDKILTQYDRCDGFKPDLGEKIGNFTLGSLRCVFGKIVCVTKEGPDPLAYTTRAKVKAIGILFLCAPILPLVILVGFVATYLSSTHGKNIPSPKDFSPHSPLSPEKTTSPIKQESPLTPESPKTPEPPKVKPKFGLSDSDIESLNNGTNDFRIVGLNTIEQISEYVAVYGNEMKALTLSDLDLTQETSLFKGRIFNFISLKSCKITREQLNHIWASEIALTDGTLTNELTANCYFYQGCTRLDLTNNNLDDTIINRIYSLGSRHNLQWLNLSKNNLSDQIFKYINSYNITLDVSHNKITDAGLIQAYQEIPNLRYHSPNFSHNLITAKGIEELKKIVPFKENLSLQFFSDALPLENCRQIIVSMAKTHGDRGALLEHGYTPKEIGIITVVQLRDAIVNCYKLPEVSDWSGVDFTTHLVTKELFSSRATYSIKTLILKGCNLGPDALQVIADLSRFTSIDISDNPRLTDKVVKHCFDGEIPSFVTSIQPVNRAPSQEDITNIKQIIHDYTKEVIQYRKRLIDLKLKMFNHGVEDIFELKKLPAQISERTKDALLFNMTKRFHVELDGSAKNIILNLLNANPFDKEVFVKTLLFLANVTSIEEYVDQDISYKHFSKESYKYKSDIQTTISKAHIEIENNELEPLIEVAANLTTYAHGLLKYLNDSEEMMIRILITSANRIERQPEAIADEILSCMSYTDLDKEKLKNALIPDLSIKGVSTQDVIRKIIDHLDAKGSFLPVNKPRTLPVASMEEIKNYTLSG